ncbi:leucine-rich repeats and immunoglobulin-like domains protein 1 [Onthophagus taurus]|uniref:leucine-rich repeats and immunoglobulin-like domains protein 1 n=1 Tax=Onthophagus taurus TaxID=166361 RepID=UPI000C202996|nr:leucine-rich repeats and immunoglobulin-like domains protein 1 [Onthophagus taurus]
MWWLLWMLWWCGTSAVPAPGPDPWKCPEISHPPIVECSCDMPHTLRCTGDSTAMEIIGRRLKDLDTAYVSLLDCTVQNFTKLPGLLLKGVALHGLVISSGEISEIHRSAFEGLSAPLQALGLPNNQLTTVPTEALKSLPELDRLDLSGNRLRVLSETSFYGLKNLSFIELSNNIIWKIHPDCFNKRFLPQLRTLRLRNNKLNITSISYLSSFEILEELDLSNNNLIGPLKLDTFPNMDLIRDLQLSHNSFSSIKMGALKKFYNLKILSLHHNQIDVLEDHAFVNLTNLTNLDLAHNRIVAVSGASLAHLTNLIDLDLRHNFLRALTADVIIPLRRLETLKLDENDISIIASDALRATTVLKRLSLSDNPLNCDCSLVEFAAWLSNSTLKQEDKESAICTTPPSLENALLIDINLKDLLCGEEEENQSPIKIKINLENYIFNGEEIFLQWFIEEKAAPYSCDAIFVYEDEGDNEVLLESNDLKCNSTNMLDSRFLNVTVPNVKNLIQNHKYRYCVVLIGSPQNTDELSLILGCSEIIPLIKNVNVNPTLHQELYKNQHISPKVIGIDANFTSIGNLAINVNIQPIKNQKQCELNIVIFELDDFNVLFQHKINCSSPKYTFSGLQDNSYKICVNIIYNSSPSLFIERLNQQNKQKQSCVTVFKEEIKNRKISTLDVAFVTSFLVLTFTVLVIIWAVRKILLRPKLHHHHHHQTHHQCFLPPPDLDEQQRQHNRYVKLQATTKL